jgi:hypothetical protein
LKVSGLLTVKGMTKKRKTIKQAAVRIVMRTLRTMRKERGKRHWRSRRLPLKSKMARQGSYS